MQFIHITKGKVFYIFWAMSMCWPDSFLHSDLLLLLWAAFMTFALKDMYYRGQKCPGRASIDQIASLHYPLLSSALQTTFRMQMLAWLMPAESAPIKFGRRSHILGTSVPDSTFSKQSICSVKRNTGNTCILTIGPYSTDSAYGRFHFQSTETPVCWRLDRIVQIQHTESFVFWIRRHLYFNGWAVYHRFSIQHLPFSGYGNTCTLTVGPYTTDSAYGVFRFLNTESTCTLTVEPYDSAYRVFRFFNT